MNKQESRTLNGVKIELGEKICPSCHGQKCHITGHCFNARICSTCLGRGKISTTTPVTNSTDHLNNLIYSIDG